ncbi:uncharacterized protein LOC122859040 [Aphidius gifuensis]|nr:uncharacterized protein LOC122859040 [Aphidius gifuensis]
MLLNAKKASKSISSLVSCFSIDSKLAIKTYLTQYNNDINAIITNDNITSTKLIKLPKKKYLISRISPIGFTPLRAINDIFIHDENDDIINMKKCQDKNLIIQNENLCFSNELTKFTNDNNIKPLIIPIGPIIKTPISVKIAKPCMKNNKKRQCKLSADERDNLKLDKIVCYTEDILFNMLFPMKSINNENEQFKIVENNRDIETANDGKKNSSISMNANRSSDEYIDTQSLIENEDFISTNNDSIFIISANMKLENRNNKEEHHHKACYYAAILCILAKTVKNIHEFYGSLLDQLIILASKYYNKTGLLRYKQVRNFRNINILNIKFNIIVKQIIYADPENYENDLLTNKIKEYLSKYPSGILIFDNASYAFWFSNGCYYIFDPYPCDDEGHASDTGTGCVLKYCKLDDMIDKISNYSGVDVTKPYRIHNLSIGHIEMINHDDNKKTKFTLKENNKSDDENAYEKEDYHDVVDADNDDDDDKSEDDNEEEQEILKSKSQESLIELTSWLDEVNKNKKSNTNLTPKPAYVALNNLHASVLEVTVVEDDITQAILTPFKLSKDKNITNEYIRKKPYIRKFNKQSIILLPIDLCIISWSCIIDPSKWSENIIKAIYETSKDISFDCLLSSEDFTVDNMIDGMLTEFEIGNYNFKTVFAPLHIGKLYSHQGWNLSMSLKKIFDNSIYTGAIIFCGTSHIGVMKKLNKLYAWWCIDDTKNIKIIMSDNMEDYLKIIIQKINITEEIEFKIRIITVSYAKILDPNCSDIGGLHDEIMPSSSLPQIHQNNNGPYDLHAIFKPTIPGLKPIFVFGTVALDSFDIINEPNVKRCYFVGILSVMMKRDIIQSPMPSIIDKIIKLSEDLYRQFNQPKYHTEHIIHNVNLMNRIFEFRDVASSLNVLHNNHEKNNFFSTVKKELKKYFNKHNDGVIHFSNCCYGFWYSQSTNCYYYLDPYRCNAKGKRQLNNIGNSCLKIFSTLCQMIESMSKNKINNTTGFFIHQIHIESINALTDKNFKEDFMWIYLDYHWSFSHQKLPSVLDKKLDNKTNKKRKKNDNICKNLNDDNDQNKNILYWNNYVIEIPQLIYSLWGTIGTYDERFANRIGKNKMAICISIIAMQNLCHPSKWTSAILDSAVICGDCYYIESIKNKRNNLMDNDGFNLQSCFKIYPHIWKIKYLPKKCGVLYDNNDKLSLAVTLKLALEESNNILLNCDNITIGIIKCEDGYYAVDPCWTGPPLFIRNHGAVYVLRCRNISALIYALIKMINTNLRLEFNITPIIFEYKKEICKSSNVKTMKKKIFMEPLDTKPGFTRGPCTPVPGSITAGNQDIYSEYKNNIKLGMEHGSELENPIIPSPIPHLSDERTKNFMISTKWHKYSGQNQPRKSSSPIDDINIYDNPKMTSSSPSFLDVCDDYPKTIDFIDDKLIKSKIKQQKNKTSLSIPLDCLPPKKFILKENKKEYKKTIAEMSDDVYKNYQHQSKVEKKTDEQLDEDLDEKLVEDVDKSP